MSKFTKKGYRVIDAIDPKTGRRFKVPVEIGGRVDKAQTFRAEKLEKQRRKTNAEYKKKLREFKKTIPLEERAKVKFTPSI